MARIRSIKPEFWTDEKIASLPKSTALFFIALWNFADDQGIVTDSSRTLSLQVPIYRSQDIDKMLNALWKAALIKRSPSDGLVFINGWAHQKIDRPRDGKYKGKEINWLTWCDSANDRESSSNIRRKDRIGKDTIGSDRIVSKGGQKAGKEKPDTDLNRDIWEAYRKAYSNRYLVDPVRNQTTNSQISQLAKRLGNEAPEVVSFYLTHNDAFYVKATHAIGLCLRDCESLRTQMLRGRGITFTEAKNFEKTDSAKSQAEMFRRMSEQV